MVAGSTNNGSGSDGVAKPDLLPVVASAINVGTPLSLLILSDIRFLREGLAEVFERNGAFKVDVDPDLAAALVAIRASSPRILLIDASLPDWPSALRRLREVAKTTRIAALGVSETQQEIIAWAEAGACGYIPRSAALSDLARCSATPRQRGGADWAGRTDYPPPGCRSQQQSHCAPSQHQRRNCQVPRS
jgi:DNA-binding response OmpR family regulator